eukprot:2117543-Rhodomonas_salina.2
MSGAIPPVNCYESRFDHLTHAPTTMGKKGRKGVLCFQMTHPSAPLSPSRRGARNHGQDRRRDRTYSGPLRSHGEFDASNLVVFSCSASLVAAARGGQDVVPHAEGGFIFD